MFKLFKSKAERQAEVEAVENAQREVGRRIHEEHMERRREEQRHDKMTNSMCAHYGHWYSLKFPTTTVVDAEGVSKEMRFSPAIRPVESYELCFNKLDECKSQHVILHYRDVTHYDALEGDDAVQTGQSVVLGLAPLGDLDDIQPYGNHDDLLKKGQLEAQRIMEIMQDLIKLGIFIDTQLRHRQWLVYRVDFVRHTEIPTAHRLGVPTYDVSGTQTSVYSVTMPGWTVDGKPVQSSE